jgi:glycosyltransferase involved in cell wall biosynthesis
MIADLRTVMTHALFLMEQHIGHRAFYLNLRKFIETDESLKTDWVEITYKNDPPNLVERIPFVPERVSGPFVGRKQILRGLRRPHDIAIFNTQVPAVLAGSAARHTPYILCTDITPIQYDQMAKHYGHLPDRGGVVSRYKHNANVATFGSAARLLPWSSWVRDSLIHDYGVNPDRVEVLPPGVDTEIWCPVARAARGRVRILFVGGDFYRKGGELLLEAFRTLPRGSTELILITRSQLSPEPNVRVVNHMDPNSPELIALCQSCDLFVLPTQAEAFGIAALEASALGLPVVATSVGGLPDIVADGETGYLIPPGDGRALGNCLHQIVGDASLRARLGSAGRERVLARFDARKNATRMAEILCSVVSNQVNA